MGSIYRSLRNSMKVAIILLACVAASLAQHGPGGHHGHPNHLAHLVHNEVVELIKGDAVFDLIADNDEAHLDAMCKGACECEINKNCQPPPHMTHGPRTTPTAAP